MSTMRCQTFGLYLVLSLTSSHKRPFIEQHGRAGMGVSAHPPSVSFPAFSNEIIAISQNCGPA